MNENAKKLLVRLYDSWKGSSEWGANGTDKLKEYCDKIRGILVPVSDAFDEDEIKKLLFGKPSDAPSLGQSLRNFPDNEKRGKCRANPKEYARIAKEILIDGHEANSEISPEDYNAFFAAFVDAGKPEKGKPEKPRPKMVINRLVCLLFPNQFAQVPSEEKVTVIYDGLKNIGAIGKAEDADGWFAQNTAIMKALKEALPVDGQDNPTALDLGCFADYLNSAFTARNPMARAVVKYGPPGTGKTYSAVRDAKRALVEWSAHAAMGKDFLDEREHIQVVQFHPSYDYEDFIEGLRPKKVDNAFPLRLVNGDFKKFCIKAGQCEIDLFRHLKEMSDGRKKPDGSAKTRSVSDLLDMTVKEIRELFGKLEGGHWAFLKSADEKLRLREALPPYYFIIDEINRAELSRVFGELMFCIENRGPDGAVSTQYAGLNDKETGMLNFGSADEGDKADWRFFVPSNVHIVGTMNVIDRSVESFDFALRRRFVWERDDPDPSVIRVFVGELAAERELGSEVSGKIADELVKSLDALNEKIKEMINEKKSGLGDDWCIGHAFFKDIKYVACGSKMADGIVEAIRDWVWSNSIRPLLEEYLRGSGSDEKDYMKGFREAFFQDKKERVAGGR